MFCSTFMATFCTEKNDNVTRFGISFCLHVSKPVAFPNLETNNLDEDKRFSA